MADCQQVTEYSESSVSVLAQVLAYTGYCSFLVNGCFHAKLRILTSMEKELIRKIIAATAKLKVDISELTDDSNLYDAGLTSLNTVNLMLAVEDQFDIEFDDEALSRETFKSVKALVGVVAGLMDTAA